MKTKTLENLTLLSATSLPVCTLAIKGWANGALILSGLLSLLLISFSPVMALRNQHSFSRAEKWFLFAFATPLLSTLFSAALRSDFHPAQFDSPARFLLAGIVYLFIRGSRRDIMQCLNITIAAGALTAAVYQLMHYDFSHGLATRATTHFMDSIMLGYIALCLGVLALYSAASGHIKSKPLQYVSVLAGIIGIGLSVLTKSRTGWLALPFVLVLLGFQLSRHKSLNLRKAIPGLALAGAVLLAISFPTLQQRFNEAAREISTYSFEGIAPDSSNGLRITYWRIGVELLKQRPIQGYGDTARTTPVFPESALSYSSQFARDTVFLVGFHNEFFATTVRAGLLGGLSIMLVFIVPLIIFVRQVSNPDLDKRHAAALGTCLVLIVLISSLTIETFGLKFATSFYALMVSMLLSQTLKADHAGI